MVLHIKAIRLTQPLSVKYSAHYLNSKAEFADMMLIPFGKLFDGKNIIRLQSDHLFPKSFGIIPLVRFFVDQRQGPPSVLCNPRLRRKGQAPKNTSG